MTNNNEIDELIKLPEGKTLDFKRELSKNHDGLIKTIIGFANASGGKIVFGVTDGKREVVGVPKPELLEEQVASIIANNISPRIIPNIEFIDYNGKTIVIVEIYTGSDTPYHFKGSDPIGSTFVRIGSTNREADRHIVRNLERRAMNEDFDELPQLNLSLKDIDTVQFEKVMKDFHKNVTKDSLETFRLVHKEQGKVVPTNAGIILFGKNRRKYFPESYIQCGRFSGTSRVNILDSRDIDTSPILAVDEVMDFVKKHALHGLVIDVERFGSKHFDNWNVPLNALREIVINALMHQDYSVKNTRMQVAIYDDRIEIVSPGGLVPGMTVEDMKKVKSIRRNSAIAGVFKELKITETWGSGAQRAIDEIVNFGLPEPEITEGIDGLKWTVWVDIKEPHDFKIDHPIISDNEQNTSDKLAIISLTERRMADKIKKYLEKHGELDTPTAAKLLKKSQPTARNLLRELAEVGELVAKGANKNRTYSLAIN